MADRKPTPPPMRSSYDSKPHMAATNAQLQILSQSFTVFTTTVNDGFKEVNKTQKETCEQLKNLTTAFLAKVEQDEKDKLSARLWVATIVSVASLLSGMLLKFFS